MTHKVTVAGRIFRGDNGEAPRQRRKGKLFLQVHKSLILKPFDGFATKVFFFAE